MLVHCLLFTSSLAIVGKEVAEEFDELPKFDVIAVMGCGPGGGSGGDEEDEEEDEDEDDEELSLGNLLFV
jgi:hypothetical protein